MEGGRGQGREGEGDGERKRGSVGEVDRTKKGKGGSDDSNMVGHVDVLEGAR